MQGIFSYVQIQQQQQDELSGAIWAKDISCIDTINQGNSGYLNKNHGELWENKARQFSWKNFEFV